MDPIVQWINDRGWNPDAPNEACTQALKRPELLSRLSAEDADGCHFILTYMEYERLLQDAPGDEDRKHVIKLGAAAYVVLASQGALPLPAEEIHNRRHRFEVWNRDVLEPSRVRLLDAMHAHERDDRDWIERHRNELEPAFTLGMIERERFCDQDLFAEQKRMSIGLVLQDQGVRRAKRSHQVDVLGFDPFMAYFNLLTNPNRSVTRFGDDGLSRIDPLLVKQAMDETTGRIQNPKNQERSGLLQDERVDHEDPASALMLAEATDIVDEMVKAKGVKGRDQRAVEIVGKHIRELLSGEMTIRRLALRTKVSRPTLQAAFDLIRERIQRKLG